MKREVKFRAWDEKLKKMFVPSHIDGDGTLVTEERHDNGDGTWGTHPIEYPNPHVLMQFTGLTDKNGKEIYEGDIMRSPWDEKDIGAVEYGGNSFSLPFGYEETELLLLEGGEVIGNIYENPELLK